MCEQACICNFFTYRTLSFVTATLFCVLIFTLILAATCACFDLGALTTGDRAFTPFFGPFVTTLAARFGLGFGALCAGALVVDTLGPLGPLGVAIAVGDAPVTIGIEELTGGTEATRHVSRCPWTRCEAFICGSIAFAKEVTGKTTTRPCRVSWTLSNRQVILPVTNGILGWVVSRTFINKFLDDGVN